MNFSELKQELADRGFDHLSDTRRGRYINAARAELDLMALWPYREASVTGLTPLIIADLGVIEVVNYDATDRKLPRADFGQLVERYGDLSIAGDPGCYYIASPSAQPTVAVYPVPTTSITVQYWKRPTTLSAAGDTPLAPVDWHTLYVDIAQGMAYRDGDNHAAARAMREEINERKLQMMTDLLSQSIDPTFIERTTGEGY